MLHSSPDKSRIGQDERGKCHEWENKYKILMKHKIKSITTQLLYVNIVTNTNSLDVSAPNSGLLQAP